MRSSWAWSDRRIGLGAEGTKMDILDMAREAGFAVLLDGRIGQEEYSTVSGSKEALQSFANAARIAAEREHLRRARFGQAARQRRRAAARKAANSPGERADQCGARKTGVDMPALSAERQEDAFFWRAAALQPEFNLSKLGIRLAVPEGHFHSQR
jgi:hypothetical protein